MSEATLTLKKQLEDGVVSVLENKDFKAVLDYAAAFWKYSISNSFLIVSQMPEATQVGSYKAWQKVGRQVQKGEKGIKIFVPTPFKVRGEDGKPLTSIKDGSELKRMAFKIGNVFDISQTEGDEPPEDTLKRGPIKGEYHGDVLITLVAMATEMGSKVVFEENLGVKNALGYYRPSDKSIHIKDGRATNDMTRTMIHELAHALEDSMALQKGERDYDAGEAMAEGAAYIVSKALGVDTDNTSFPYIARYITTTERFIPTLNGAVKIGRAILENLTSAPVALGDDEQEQVA